MSGQASAEEPILHDEPGSSWWPVLWAPAFSGAGIAFDAAVGARPHVFGWTIVGLVLLLFTTLWVSARRRFLAVRLTATTLTEGREQLPVARIAAVDDVGTPTGTAVLGGGWSVPRKYEELPLRLDDGSVVLAWARDIDTLTECLRELITARQARHDGHAAAE